MFELIVERRLMLFNTQACTGATDPFLWQMITERVTSNHVLNLFASQTSKTMEKPMQQANAVQIA